MFRSSGGARQTCILMQHPAALDDDLDFTEPSGQGSVYKRSSREAEAGGDETRFPVAITPHALLSRLILVIGLSLTLFSVGTLLFISGFFLSKDDLPYISNGRIIPFPPLFPHLDPARLQLNREESVYYVESSGPRAPRSTGSHVDSDGSPRPLYLEQFTDPKLFPLSSEPEPCQVQPCRSSWVSVTPYDRVVVFLIDAMRYDFLLWDPDASSACEDDATKECVRAPSGLRPFYRNRMPLAHDLLRRSDADLQRFLLSLVKNREMSAEELGSSAAALKKDLSSRETKLPPSASQTSPASLPSTYNWGGNRFTRLYIFEADPPTATTQRLSGLATGSMPSFFSVRFSGFSTRRVRKERHSRWEHALGGWL